MRDTFLWRLRQKECARIDCDTKHEWVSNMKITKQQLKQIIKEELSKALNENESNVDVNSRIGERFTKWFGGPIHRDKAPAAAKSLATDLRAGKFLSSVPEELKEQYTQLFNNLADALEQNPLLTHFRKLGKRGNWYAIATGNWDESMYNPPPYSDPNARRDYGWEN